MYREKLPFPNSAGGERSQVLAGLEVSGAWRMCVSGGADKHTRRNELCTGVMKEMLYVRSFRQRSSPGFAAVNDN